MGDLPGAAIVVVVVAVAVVVVVVVVVVDAAAAAVGGGVAPCNSVLRRSDDCDGISSKKSRQISHFYC